MAPLLGVLAVLSCLVVVGVVIARRYVIPGSVLPAPLSHHLVTIGCAR
jgi:hypothetical protein